MLTNYHSKLKRSEYMLVTWYAEGFTINEISKMMHAQPMKVKAYLDKTIRKLY